MDYTFHEMANLFPMMDAETFEDLKKDISTNGLLEPIWLQNNQIIDGRNRYKACLETGITPSFREWEGKGSPIKFVLSLNLNRRHLTPSQRAVIAAGMLPMLEVEAKERQRLAGMQYGEKHPKLEIAPVSEQSLKGRAAEQAADLMGVGKTAVYIAKKIALEAPEKLQEIQEGKCTLNKVDLELRKSTTHKELKQSQEAPGRITALNYATLAISKLTQIRQDDPQRVEAFTEVIDYCNSQLDSKEHKIVIECVAAGLPKSTTHQIAVLYGNGSEANKAIRKFPEYEFQDIKKCKTDKGRLLATLENRLKGHYQQYPEI